AGITGPIVVEDANAPRAHLAPPGTYRSSSAGGERLCAPPANRLAAPGLLGRTTQPSPGSRGHGLEGRQTVIRVAGLLPRPVRRDRPSLAAPAREPTPPRRPSGSAKPLHRGRRRPATPGETRSPGPPAPAPPPPGRRTAAAPPGSLAPHALRGSGARVPPGRQRG